ncbi:MULTISPECIES: M56 family metallopeptidase [Gordonia]|uniref:M56 family metallopeptidase n=1 Tax=Gordonia amicalis TaxID=89053 RepID=A0AAE4U8N1_9ACTN|nr:MULTISPECIES: M56 family metallopeptidase [Gordonia]ATD69126.1 Zn-dependent protease with chaperone function [Gordonia sp. 1D]KAF0969002.1 hypothetical protein BPODLACK_02660 [Gordonia sp. YY1]MBA5847606.1 M56 family metallopeptidase [Gordonia amicalis]MCZ4654012.1 M56 family metallopeptidase [Gordonia amicalis]MDJ0453826.1 M56 family metallopeptidase [Gordonia amicalis]
MLVTVAVVVAAFVAAGWLGPRALRRAAPALSRAPRVATGLLMACAALWAGALLAIGPMFAWVLRGPQILPSGAAEVCQRCLASASPWSTGTVETALPTVLFLLAPVVIVLTASWVGARYVYRSTMSTRATAAAFAAVTTPGEIAGHRVRVLDDATPVVFALPRRRGGIIISRGAVQLLDGVELRAVLEHESAHLRQRHHLIALVVGALGAPLRWSPLLDSIVEAVPHYLEIAADNAARHAVSTPALATALLKLGGHRTHVPGALHAGGPDRIGQLVAVADGSRRGAVPTAAIVAFMVFSALVTASIYASYLMAANACIR